MRLNLESCSGSYLYCKNKNAILEGGLEELPLFSSLPKPLKHLTFQDVHAFPELNSHVESKLHQLGLSDYLSGSEDSADGGDGKWDKQA